MFGEIQPTRYDWNFVLWGIPVRIHPLFWLFAFLFSPYLSRPIGEMSHWLMGLTGWVCAWFLSFLVHEFGHALVLQRHYGAAPWVVLYGFGGMACHRPYYRRAPGPWGRILISFAGPGAELLSVAALVGLLLLFRIELALGVSSMGIVPLPMIVPVGIFEMVRTTGSSLFIFLGMFVYSYLWMGIFWSVLNLFPIYPLDGGHIAREFLTTTDRRNGFVTSVWISIICAVALGLYLLDNGSFFGAIFFGFLAFQNYQSLSMPRRG